MHIRFSPQLRGDSLTLSKSGDILTVNGEAFDFSALPDGATLLREAVACDWLASDVERIDGVVALSLILPHGPQAPAGTRFPQPVDATDGPIAVPPRDEEAQA